MRRWHRLLDLAPADRRLLLEAIPLVLAIRLGLWLLPFRTLRRLLEKAVSEDRGPDGEDRIVERVAWAVKAASRRVPAATCLTQALAAQVLLRRRGLSPRLHIGVAKDENARLLAHAWVESEGRIVVGGRGHKRYTSLLVLERDSNPG